MQIPMNFFQAEEREGFLISEMMKRAWAAAMEVTEIVDSICKKHHIPYFADSGTLLGAVRHKGFIPWDDDIDIALLRKEYNQLIQILPHELPEGFVLAGMYSPDSRLQEACDVAHLRVIADEEYWNLPNYMNRFHAFPYPRIGIDIFPLDYIPDDSEFAELQQQLLYKTLNLTTNWNHKIQDKDSFEQELQELEILCKVTFRRDDTLKNQLWKLFDRLCCLATEEESTFINNYAWTLLVKKVPFHKSWYQKTEYLPFEGMTLPVPHMYDEVLRALYGDYNVFVKNEAGHDYPFYASQKEALQEVFQSAGITKSVDTFCHEWYIAMQKKNK